MKRGSSDREEKQLELKTRKKNRTKECTKVRSVVFVLSSVSNGSDQKDFRRT